MGDERAEAKQALDRLRADIQAGLDDIDAGRVHDFDIDQIVKEGKRRLADRSPSA